MINILIPLAKHAKTFESLQYPKPLLGVNGRLMIEYPVVSLGRIKDDKRFVFILRNEDCVKYHFDKTVKLLAGENTVIVRQTGDTRGAVCSALLAIDHINNDDPLIITNGDQFLNVNYDEILADFRTSQVDGGVITFDSVHPQWSYAKVEGDAGILVETAEKNPISRNAIAGFYYFRKGSDFIRAAGRLIEHDAQVNGLFYISMVYNEMILEGLRSKAHRIPSDRYHSFYAFETIREFEKLNIDL